ncbi:glycosyltransferase [Desulfovibrio sp. TomC]|uniref:glycosyltransferase n=1 Tax=Desulfovibrio sp. TomC TaxID=1562888 RepID=UPI0005749812|nr:glycosyltransferase [Desulfovibrio sp. TomC]KHK04110.1 Glycosyl transferase, family 2 [Desulfovibrio sp. TomC]
MTPAQTAVDFLRFAVLLAALAGLALCGRFAAGRLVYGSCFAAAFAALVWSVRHVPANRPRGRITAIILTLAVLIRLLFFWAWPADSDINRYIVEGNMQSAAGNPYQLAPGDPAVLPLLSPTGRELLSRVNHPELSAAYPPLAELVCRLTAFVSPTPAAFKTVALLADLVACLLLVRILAARCLPPVWLAFFALNPLTLAMGVGEGHLDALVALAVVLALGAFDRRRDGWGFFWLGVAGMVKYPALLLIPFFWRRGNVARTVWCLLPLACFWPYREAGGDVFRSLTVFAGYVSHGGPLTAVFQPLLGGLAPAVSLAIGATILAVGWLAVQDRLRGGLWAMVTVLACLPTVYPWYWLVVVPFWLLRPGWPVLWLLAGQGLATAPTWLRGSGLGGEGTAMAAVWLPFALLLILALRRPTFVAKLQAFGPVRTLSVIVPTRNEQVVIGRCLGSLLGTGVAEVVVADGGSGDATGALAKGQGARVVVADGGRGGQIAAALRHCRGDVVLVLHADAVLAPDVPTRIVRALNAWPQVAGGVVGMRFDVPGQGLFLLTRLNALRSVAMGIGFGDQGQFFRREALAAAGGFPNMALMEDVEVSLRLRSVGETISLGGGIVVSGRRWAGPGFGGKAVGVIRLFLIYLAGRRLGLADPTGWWYYKRYYGRPPHHTAV